MLLVGLTSPIMGAAADHGNRKKLFLFIYTIVCVVATIMLYSLEPGMIVVIGGYFSYDKASFYIVGLIAGIAMGSSQAASRALMGGLIPEFH